MRDNMLILSLCHRVIVQSSLEPAQILQSVLWLHPDQNQSAPTAHREGAQGLSSCRFLLHMTNMTLSINVRVIRTLLISTGIWIASSGLCQDLQVERHQFLVHQTVSWENPPVRYHPDLICAVPYNWKFFRAKCPGHGLTMFCLYSFLSGLSSSLLRSLRRLWMAQVFPHWWNREAAPAWTVWMPTQRRLPSIGFTRHWRSLCLGRVEICRMRAQVEELKLHLYRDVFLFCLGRWRKCARSCWRNTQCLSWLKTWTASLVGNSLKHHKTKVWWADWHDIYYVLITFTLSEEHVWFEWPHGLSFGSTLRIICILQLLVC